MRQLYLLLNIRVVRKAYYLLFVLVAAFACCLTACSGEKKEDGTPYQVYYLDEEGTGLAREEFIYQEGSQDIVDVLTELLNRLSAEDAGSHYKPPISVSMEVSDFQLKENQLSLYFTAAYQNANGIDEVLARAAIVKTLCQVEGVDYVEFFVEDQPLMIQGEAVGLMASDSFILDLGDDQTEQSKQVTLYFADEGGQRLRSLSAEVTYNAAKPLAQMLIQKLIDGPSSIPGADTSHIIAALPSDTVLNSTTIRNNVCYVDLSREFTGMLTNVSSDVVIYSVVNTLCELPNVNRVQFLIDGKPQDKYGETMNFYLPFERNLDLLMGETLETE